MRILLLAILFLFYGTAECLAGVLCLTFDDRNFDSWTNALPIFAKYDAHATFFPHGKLEEAELEKLGLLSRAGHSVGIHTISHQNVLPKFDRFLGAWRFYVRDVLPQIWSLRKMDVRPCAFAYPYGNHSAASDEWLGLRFRFVRGAEMRCYVTNGVSLVSCDRVFIPIASIRQETYLPAVAVGEAYKTDIEDLCRGIKRLGGRDEMLCLFSHDIRQDAMGNGMKTDWLVTLLDTAQKYNVQVKGLDEL